MADWLCNEMNAISRQLLDQFEVACTEMSNLTMMKLFSSSASAKAIGAKPAHATTFQGIYMDSESTEFDSFQGILSS